MPFPGIYPILNADFLPGDEHGRTEILQALVRDFAAVGIGILQYRNKQGREAEILSDAQAMRAAAYSGIKLILNDWPHLAVEANFDGVHVGQGDISPAAARAIVGAERIVGVSTHNEAQVRAAEREPVDYIAVGPVFATASKQNPDPVIGLEGVKRARALTTKPLVAIGGITLTTAPTVKAAGADSLALISAIFSKSGSPAKFAEDFLRIFR